MKNAKRRSIWYFVCRGCGKRRQTVKRNRARKGICLQCKFEGVNPMQTSLFDPINGKTVEINSQVDDKNPGNIIIN